MQFTQRKDVLTAVGVLIMVLGVCMACASLGGLTMLVFQEQLYPAPTMTPTASATPTPVASVTSTPAFTAPDEAELEEQYYRGFFDLCAAYMQSDGATYEDASEFCNGVIIERRASGWYEEESPGFVWGEEP